jgi:hypothetical protein
MEHLDPRQLLSSNLAENVATNLPLTTRPAVVAPPIPPASPPIQVNPQTNGRIDTAETGLIRVNVWGGPGFDVTRIDPATVTLGGARPVFAFDRFNVHDQALDATFAFEATDVHLPPGFTQAGVAGELSDGRTFRSTVAVFNRDRFSSTAAPGAAEPQQGTPDAGSRVAPPLPPVLWRQANVWINPERTTPAVTIPSHRADTITPAPPPVVPAPVKVVTTPAPTQPQIRTKPAKPVVPAAPVAGSPPVPAATTVMVPTSSNPAVLTNKLQQSLNRYIRQVGAVQLNTAMVIAGPSQGSTVPSTLKGVQAPYLRQITVSSSRPSGPIPGGAVSPAAAAGLTRPGLAS